MALSSKLPPYLKSKLVWVVVGVPLLVAAAFVGVWLYGYSSLNSQLAALRAQGLPTNGRELNDFYRVPEGATDTTDLWVAAIDGVVAANLDKRGKDLPIIGLDETPIPPPGEPWANLEASRMLLTELEAELQAIRRAAAAGGQVRFPVDFSAGIETLLPHTENSRQAARLLVLDAHVSAHDGNHARALEDVRAIFAVRDAFRNEPFIISQLVRMAIHVIGCDAAQRLVPHCGWSDEDLSAMQSSIGGADFKQGISDAYCGERAICLDAMDLMFRPLRQENKQEALRFFERSIDGFSGEWPEAIECQRELADELKGLTGSKFNRIRMSGVLMLLPALEQVATAGARAEARQRCAVAALAAQRHRLQHGQLPASLGEIEPRLFGPSFDPATGLSDPFDGQPLRFKLDESRLVIYSIGDDGQDDGGNFGDGVPVTTDWGFALQP